MDSENYQGTYIGYSIEGCLLDKVGDYVEWQFRVTDNEANSVFKLSLLVSHSALAMNHLNPQTASSYVRDEGLKRVKGRLILNRYNQGGEYRHRVLATGEDVDSADTMNFPPFNSDEEKVRYFLLKALKRIRVELLPDRFNYVQIDVAGLCSFLGVPTRSGRAALSILGENNLISGNEMPSDQTCGGFEYASLYITSAGIDEFNNLEREIINRWSNAMPNLSENAFLILGILHEKGATSIASSMKADEVEHLIDLSTDDFSGMKHFLLSANYIKFTPDGFVGRWWLTAEGINWFKSEKEKRIPLTVDALRISRFVYRKTSDSSNSYVASRDILDGLKLEETAYRKACQELADRGLLEVKQISDQILFRAVTLTPAGRNAHRDRYKATPPAYPTQQNIGAVFQGQVTDSNIQAIAVSFNSNIQQAINVGSVQDLRDEILNLIEQLVGQVKHELNLDQLSLYINAAKELKHEIKKPNPNSTVIQRIFVTLDLLGNVDGAIELGKKGLELSAKYGPLVLALKQAILQLLQLTGS